MSKNRFTPFFQPYTGSKRVYISGPMTGYENENQEAFAEAAETLRDRGYMVCNPHETSTLLGELTHSEYLRFDFERVLEADFLVALDGWEQSLGALAEILMAVRMDVKVWRWSTFENYDRITYEDVATAIGRHGTANQIIHIDGDSSSYQWDPRWGQWSYTYE